MEMMRAQSARFGTRIYTETVERVDLHRRPFLVVTPERGVHARTIILATGATAKRLTVEGEDKLWQAGISACAGGERAPPAYRGQAPGRGGGGATRRWRRRRTSPSSAVGCTWCTGGTSCARRRSCSSGCSRTRR